MSQQKRFNHAGGTGFTVSSGDVDDRGGAVHIPEDFNGSANRIQPGSHLIFGGACQQFTVGAFNPFGVRDCWVAHLAHSVLSLAGIKLCDTGSLPGFCYVQIYVWVYSRPSTVHTAVCYMCWGGLVAILPLFYAAFATVMVRLSPSVRSRETARVSPVTSSSWVRRASKVSCGALTVRLMRSETFSPASLRAC